MNTPNSSIVSEVGLDGIFEHRTGCDKGRSTVVSLSGMSSDVFLCLEWDLAHGIKMLAYFVQSEVPLATCPGPCENPTGLNVPPGQRVHYLRYDGIDIARSSYERRTSVHILRDFLANTRHPPP